MTLPPPTEHSPKDARAPNPQGKGVIPVLDDLQAVRTLPAGPDNAADFLRDYVMSSLVLAAEFQFKPVPQTPYYLYYTDPSWKLSLVAPHEWGERPIGQFLAHCRLRSNLTWDVEIAEDALNTPGLGGASAFVVAFVEDLLHQDNIADHLPTYVAHLPYYRRLMASGLAASLGASLPVIDHDLTRLLHANPSVARLLSPGPSSPT